MDIILGLVVLIFSAILHEVAHGFVADRLGDPTARLLGRLTLDPRKHIDPLWSIALPLLMILSGSPIIFGAAKPVPVDIFNLRDGRKDMALVALAGPLTNIILAVLAGILLRLVLFFSSSISPFVVSFLYPFLLGIVRLNLLLAIFNLIPIPPLDGSKIFSLALSEEQTVRFMALGKFGMLIVFMLLFFPLGPISLSGIMANLLHFAENLLIP